MSVAVPEIETEVPTTYTETLKDAEGAEYSYECTKDLETGELIEVAYDAEGNEVDMAELKLKPTGGPAFVKGSFFSRMFGMCGGKKAAPKAEVEEEEEAAEEEAEEA